MRGSPINHIRRDRLEDQSTSPFRGSAQRQAYSPDTVGADLQYWRHLSRRFESENLSLSQEIGALRRRVSTQEELQDKIEVLLAQNSHLADENENLITIIQEKKRDMDVLRSRLQGEQKSTNLVQNERRKTLQRLNIQDKEYQAQIDRLIQDNSHLHDQLQEMENLRLIEINALKNKYENEAMNQIQSLKRSQYGNHQLQELNIRKLKDMIEERQFENENIHRENKLQNERLNGEINYLKSQIKKIEHQKEHQLDLIRTENQNNRNNLVRNHRKNQQELKSLQQAKVRRLLYDIEEKKSEIEEFQGKLKKGGKQNEVDLNRMANEKSKLRQAIKENDNGNLKRINQLTKFYESQLTNMRENNEKREKSLSFLYDNQITSLKQIIDAKQEEIRRLLKLNSELKINEETRLSHINSNNDELKKKIEDLVMHYERQIELMKIKVSQLYEADLEALRSNMKNRYATFSRQRDNLLILLKETREKLAKEVQDRLDQRKDYEIRLDKFRVKYEKEQQFLQDRLARQQEQYKIETSKGTMTQIQHNSTVEEQIKHFKQMQSQKRELQKQNQYKNKEIATLNERIQVLQRYSKHEAQKLDAQIRKLKKSHQDYIQETDKQAQEWNEQRGHLKDEIHKLQLNIQAGQDRNKENEQQFTKQLEEKRLNIARKEGEIQQLQAKCGSLDVQTRVEVSNVEKTVLQTQSIMNEEKERFTKIKDQEITLKNEEYNQTLNELKAQVAELKKENELLRDNHDKSKIREAELLVENSNLLDSVNKRGVLEEHVINIGLSNNYFKNVAEIFKKSID